jgi:hypothetical protein
MLSELHEIRQHLHHLDRRDRMRMVSGTIRSVILFIPTLLLLISAWYFYKYGDKIIASLADTAAKKAAEYSTQGISSSMDINKLLDQMKK